MNNTSGTLSTPHCANCGAIMVLRQSQPYTLEGCTITNWDYYCPNCAPTITYPEPLTFLQPTRVPHTCPVCNGKGIVPNGFYTSTNDTWSTNSTAHETCRSCQGSGVLWN